MDVWLSIAAGFLILGIVVLLVGMWLMDPVFRVGVGCEARQKSDQMVCKDCDLSWDVNDQSPPPCKKWLHPGTDA